MNIKKLFSLLVTSATALMVMSCDIDRDKPLDPLDRSLHLSRDDYRKLTGIKQPKPEIINEAKTLAPPIPKVAPILAAPRPPKIQASRLVSIAVSDDVPLKDVLLELSRLADVDIEIDSGIEGGISFRAKDRPFNEVVERIANMAGLRYSMKNGVLRIERDNAYVSNYSLSFLNIVRSSTGSVNISTDVLSAGGGTEGESSISSGSAASISSEANDDFWSGLETSISQILASVPISKLSGQSTEETETAAAAEGGSSGSFAGGAFYSVNRQAGMLSLSGSQRQHELVTSYLEQIKASASAQVLIEAKIVEVSLRDEFRTGINWSAIESGAGTDGITLAFSPTDLAGSVATGSIGLEGAGIDLTSVVNLTEQFGTTRTLSSPRLHAMNNQPAVLTFAENRIFFEVTVDREDDQIAPDGTTIPGTLSVESERRSIPIGIILNILPSVDIKRNEVTLNVRPTLSRQVDTVTDPGSAIVNQVIQDSFTGTGDAPTFTNEIPVVEVRELDSIMKLRSGQVMVIGGLMEQTSTNTDRGVPFLSGIPLLGNLFKGADKLDETTELVIFIRATIVTPHGSYHDADKKVYETFTNDPRPINF